MMILSLFRVIGTSNAFMTFLPSTTIPKSNPQHSSFGTLSHSHSSLYTSLNIQDAVIEDNDEEDDDDDEDDERYEFPGSRLERDPKETAKLQKLISIPNAATLQSTTTRDMPLRYLLPLTNSSNTPFVLVDVPPYSPELHRDILEHTLQQHPLILVITNQNSIHYDETPGVYTSRKSDLAYWRQVFPQMKVILHRLDVHRDLRNSISLPKTPVNAQTEKSLTKVSPENDKGENEEDDTLTIPLVTQELDGYGPWAWDIEQDQFIESGPPLTILEWDDEKITEFFESGMEANENTDAIDEIKQQIQEHHLDKSLLAIYTPGHTMGSMTYIFPGIQTCVAGFTVPPPESTRTMDYKGYISTNRGTVERQANSIRELKDDYVEKFDIVLPSRGDPIMLTMDVDGSEEDDDLIKMKQQRLEDIVSRFEKVGKLYESLGITQPK